MKQIGMETIKNLFLWILTISLAGSIFTNLLLYDDLVQTRKKIPHTVGIGGDLLVQSGKIPNPKTEKDFVNNYCQGFTEVVLPDKTRVDCIYNGYAIEFDWAKKWAESVGQSLYYAKITGLKPAVAIIMKSEADEKYIKRIMYTDENITIFRIRAYE